MKRIFLLILCSCCLCVGHAAFGAGHFVGWGCGGVDAQGGVLLATVDGTNWFRQGVGQLPSVEISGVCASGTGQVWVVGAVEGAYAAVYHSPDNGATWSRQGDAGSLPSNVLRKICVVQTQVVWAVGDAGMVVKTENAGMTWTTVPVDGYSNALQGVAAIDGQTAWVSGSSNETGLCGLFKTTDGGLNWTLLTNGGVTNTDHILGLDAVDADHVWAIGGQETFFYSTNGGAFWETMHIGTFKDGNEIYTYGTNQVFSACDATAYWTGDNGATWTNHDLWEYTMDISAPDGTNIWAIRSNFDGGTIYHSPDGGMTWFEVYTNGNLRDLFTLSMHWRPTGHEGGARGLGTDYNGDSISDLAVYDRTIGRWYILRMDDLTAPPIVFDMHWGGDGFGPVPGDYNGDGLSDPAVYENATGIWFIRTLGDTNNPPVTFGQQWGGEGLIPVPGDYDGDGVYDLAVYAPATGRWYIRSLGPTNQPPITFGQQWGGEGLIPVPGDYDGDGVHDLAVYDEVTGNWYIRSLGSVSRPILFGMNWGGEGLVPVPGDYNGDLLSDLAVYKELTGEWFIRSLVDSVPICFGEVAGGPGMIPVPGDYDGDGVDDLSVYDRTFGDWMIRRLGVPGQPPLANGLHWGSASMDAVGGMDWGE